MTTIDNTTHDAPEELLTEGVPPMPRPAEGALGDLPLRTGALRVLGMKVATRGAPFYFVAKAGLGLRSRYATRFALTQEGWSEAWQVFALNDPEAASAYLARGSGADVSSAAPPDDVEPDRAASENGEWMGPTDLGSTSSEPASRRSGLAWIRYAGFAALAILAVAIFFNLGPSHSDLSRFQQAVATANADWTANNNSAQGAPQQQVVNGWFERDMLQIQSQQTNTLLSDRRIPALLVILVGAVCWAGVTRRWGDPIAGSSATVGAAAA